MGDQVWRLTPLPGAHCAWSRSALGGFALSAAGCVVGAGSASNYGLVAAHAVALCLSYRIGGFLREMNKQVRLRVTRSSETMHD